MPEETATPRDHEPASGPALRALWPEDRRSDAPDRLSIRSLPDAFPVFPLSRALLLPRGRLPLNIFEPRYLNLVEAAMATGRMFGMIQPASGGGLQRVGCLGRLSSFAETEDGCFLITLAGLARFSVREELPLRAGFRSVRADFTHFAADLAPPPPFTLDREGLLGELRRYFRHKGLDANWEAVDGMDADTLVTTLAMVCPFSEAEKQALLEAKDQAERAQLLLALLAMGSHEPPEGTHHVS